ncbi:MAG: ATP-grasp domain-containing protein [Tatlockia sp.]|nr:ATP-grasp domain-containing protein [Tatlockia sp.]
MPSYCKYVCIIVDAYSTGKNLAPIIRSQGLPCIHIKSSSNLPSRYQHDESNFILSLTYDGDIEALLAKIQPFIVKFCIPGYESGVELADLLCEKYNVPGNGSQYSAMKRDKYCMNEAVAQAGLATVKHCRSNHFPVLLNWTKTENGYPVVAKPLDSANGDGVFFCNNESELKEAYLTITTSKNQFGVTNKEVLLEGLNVGTEYIINTVSWQKQHFIVEIWRVTRKPNTTIYEKAEIVGWDEDEWPELAKYTTHVLQALHIQYGAATTEVKYTQEKGAVLLETSGRLMGNSPLGFLHDLSGLTQLSLLIEAYMNTDDFLERFNRARVPAKVHGVAVVLISNYEGKLTRNFGNVFTKLNTLHSFNIDSEPGTTICKTTNSLTAPGELYLMGSKEELEADYLEIRRLEETLYQQATLPVSSSFPQALFYTLTPTKEKGSAHELEQTFT